MPVMVEHFVVVGDETEALLAPNNGVSFRKRSRDYFNIKDPAEIQRRAEAEVSLEDLVKQWPASMDPESTSTPSRSCSTAA